jgi:hypothetical protein
VLNFRRGKKPLEEEERTITKRIKKNENKTRENKKRNTPLK